MVTDNIVTIIIMIILRQSMLFFQLGKTTADELPCCHISAPT